MVLLASVACLNGSAAVTRTHTPWQSACCAAPVSTSGGVLPHMHRMHICVPALPDPSQVPSQRGPQRRGPGYQQPSRSTTPRQQPPATPRQQQQAASPASPKQTHPDGGTQISSNLVPSCRWIVGFGSMHACIHALSMEHGGCQHVSASHLQVVGGMWQGVQGHAGYGHTALWLHAMSTNNI